MLYLIVFTIHLPILLLLRSITQTSSRPFTTHDLLIQTAKLGDCLNTSPLIEALGILDIVCSKDCAHLFSHYENVRKVYVVNDYKSRGLIGKLQLAYKLFSGKYTSVYALQPNSLNLFLSLMALPKTRKTLYVDYKNSLLTRLFCTLSDCTRHTKTSLTIDSYLKMSEQCYAGRNKRYPSPKLPAQEVLDIINNDGFKVGISLSAGNKLKELPTRTTCSLMESIKGKIGGQAQLLFFGISGEEERLEELKEAGCLDGIRYHNLIGKLNLDETAWSLSMINLYISSDTALSYLADCYDTPLINFMGPCNWNEQRPLGEKALIIKTPHLQPFSFIFQAPYQSDIPHTALYKIGDKEMGQIDNFLEKLSKEFVSRSS